jgi:hypothetical protein
MTSQYKKYRIDERPAYREACCDTLAFMGPKPYRLLARQIMAGATENQIRFLGCLAGVEGFPITAMIDRYSND